MRPERQDGSDGGGRPVPMAWLYAEYVAGGLLRPGDLMEPGSLEYRAGRDALALTVFLSGIGLWDVGLFDDESDDTVPAARIDELRLLTAHGTAWRDWVRARLDALEAAPGAGPGGTDPDVVLARAAWRWLEGTELLAADLDAIVPPSRNPAADEEDGAETARTWTPAWRLGLPLGHLAIHLH